MQIDLASIESAAGQAAQVLEQVMKVEPVIAGTVGMFVPAVSIVQPFVLAAAPAVEQALTAIAAGNGGNMVDALGQLIKHLMPGQPNAAALAPTPAVTPG